MIKKKPLKTRDFKLSTILESGDKIVQQISPIDSFIPNSHRLIYFMEGKMLYGHHGVREVEWPRARAESDNSIEPP